MTSAPPPLPLPSLTTTPFVSSFPRRKLLQQKQTAEFDEYGFLRDIHDSNGFEEVLDRELVVVLAAPWMGKTFVSKQLEQHFNRDAILDGTRFGRFIHRTDFERESPDEIMPTWWDGWMGSSERSCWIVDAIDEDARTGSKGTHRLLNIIGTLTPEKRARLCCIMFARENELPKKVEDRFREIYGEPNGSTHGKYCVCQLAPLDAESARDFLGGSEAFGRVCSIISSNTLQSLAGYPAALDCLSHYNADRVIDHVEVWRNVLVNLISDRNAAQDAPSRQSPIQLQFDAAARIAVILTFGDCDAVRETDGYFDGPSIDSMIPLDHLASHALNGAGRVVLRSGIFRRTIHGFQFAQHHVQQWLAAFGAAHLSLNQLRPLLVDRTGVVLKSHRGVMALLRLTTKHKSVADWIIEQHGGIPPRSDAAPRDLAQSLASLDRLQSVVKTTVWGLSLWNERGLNFLAAPHLGRELVKRLTDHSLTTLERELIVEVATATKSSETVATAMAIALDNSEDSRLRDYASTLVIRLGNKDDWQRFISALSERDGSDLLNGMKASVLIKLYDQGVWDFGLVFRSAGNLGSAGGPLFYRLENEMTIDRARIVLASIDIERLVRELGTRAYERRRHRWAQLITTAIELIVEQPSLPPSDYELLLPSALAQYRADGQSSDFIRLSTVVAKDPRSRRALFRSILQESREGDQTVSWQIVALIVPEDLDWLVEIAVADSGRHPWLWRRILQVASWKTTPEDVRNRIREIGREIVPATLSQIDDEQARAAQQEEEFQLEERKFEETTKVETFALADLVDTTLGNNSTGPCDRMHQLAWFCLCDDSFRPPNVIGKWDDLDSDRQQRVLAACEQGLRECEPTPIPAANSYLATIFYEAYCFAKVWELRESTFRPDVVQIQKWLQSVLVASASQNDSLIARCHAIDAGATQAVLIKELTRCLSFEPQSIQWVESLPPVVWTNDFCQALAAIGSDDHYALLGRVALFQKLMIVAKDVALRLLIPWITATDKQKRVAALDLLIATEPELVWNELQKQFAIDGKEALLRIRGLNPVHHAIPPGISSWGTIYLEGLHAILMEAFPPDSDPKRESGVAYGYSADDAYRDLRRGLPPLLLSRGTPDDLAALDRMANQFRSTRDWYSHVKAQKVAGAILSDLLPGIAIAKDETIAIAKIVRLLDVSVYRLIRTVTDLQAAVVEEIAEIAVDAKEHLSCLYYPRKARKDAGGGLQKTLQEDALQSYFHCRLSDRLRGRVLEGGTKVILNREPLTAKDQRLDIKVQAPTLQGDFVTVVIELKWSDHTGVSTNLTKQLGEEYLVKVGLTHGIYLVGWSKPGKWRDETIGAPADFNSADAWLAAFIAQSDAFTRMHPSVSIVPRVLDLVWPSSRTVARTNTRKRTSTRKKPAPPVRRRR